MKLRTTLKLLAVVAIILVAVMILVSGVKPQHTISRKDIVTAAVVEVDKRNLWKMPDTNITTTIWVRLNKQATTRFEKHSRKQLDQDIHILHGANNIADVALYHVATNEQAGELEFDLYFTNHDEASEAYVGLLDK
jgi:hypothetical protein